MYLYRQPFPQLSAWDGFGEPPQTAKQIYVAQSRVRELTDRGFQNIFYDRGKLIVVSFWADSCRPCDAVASTVVSVAQKIARSPHANRVKFYHAQWDPKVNPRLHTQYGFKNIPVVFFYYMSTGKPPTNAQPLLEAATRGDRFDTDSAAYLRNVETILRRHGHIASTMTIAQSRGWGDSQALLDLSDLKDVDPMLVVPSRVSQYFQDFYRANPKLRLSRVSQIAVRKFFDQEYQRINGAMPGPQVLGVTDPVNLKVFLLDMTGQLQTHLNSAVHEAVHLFTCRPKGQPATFYKQYGSGMTEGFTQIVAQEILAAQKVKMANQPYPEEYAMARKLVDKVGFGKVADDYFRCTLNVFDRLKVKSLSIRFLTLKADAENAITDAIRSQKHREIIQLLDLLPDAP